MTIGWGRDWFHHGGGPQEYDVLVITCERCGTKFTAGARANSFLGTFAYGSFEDLGKAHQHQLTCRDTAYIPLRHGSGVNDIPTHTVGGPRCYGVPLTADGMCPECGEAPPAHETQLWSRNLVDVHAKYRKMKNEP